MRVGAASRPPPPPPPPPFPPPPPPPPLTPQQGRQDLSFARQLTWARLLGMASDAARGVLYLHTRSPPVAHRDLKSANLLVDSQWHVKVRRGGGV